MPATSYRNAYSRVLLVGIQNGTTLCGQHYGRKLKMDNPMTQLSHPEINTKEKKAGYERDAWAPMCIGNQFAVIKIWKQPRHASTHYSPSYGNF